jgi:tetratricopeptide (TPR) repeat protein
LRTTLTLFITTFLLLSACLCHAEDAWLTLAERSKTALDAKDYPLAEQLSLQEMQLFVDKQEAKLDRLIYTLYTLGEIYHAQNKIAQAEDNYRKAYTLSKAEGDHPSISRLLICGRLGAVLLDDSKLDEAESTLRGCVSKMPPQSFDQYDFVARSAFISMLQHQGKFEEAESTSRDWLQAVQRELPPDSMEIADSLNMLSLSIQKENFGKRMGEAEGYLKQAISVCHKATEANDLRCATFEDNLGEQLSNQGKFDEAETYIKSALQARTLGLGENHAYTASTAFNLGRLYFLQDRYEEAVPILKKAFATLKTTYGSNSTYLEDVQHYLVSSLRKLGRDQEARRIERENGMWVVH